MEQHESIIETERLRLRELRQSDFAELYAMFNDPLVMKHYPRMRDEKGTQEWIDFVLEVTRSEATVFGPWSANQPASSSASADYCCKTLMVSPKSRLDIFSKARTGIVDMQLKRRVLFETTRSRRSDGKSVISLIRPANLPSCRVAERNGMSIEKTTTFHGFEALVYRIYAPSVVGDC